MTGGAGRESGIAGWPGRRNEGAPSRWRIAGLVFVFLWFFVGGIAHFAATDLEMRIVPPYVPWPRATVLISGVFELVGAIGLVPRPTRRSAGWMLFALTIAVTPANVWMLQNAGAWDVPRWLLIARLPLQIALLALIVWSTQPRRPASRASSRPA
jgi:uncharacterized membrane protein